MNIRKATFEDKDNIAKLWRKESEMLGALYMGALKERIEKYMVNVVYEGDNLLGFVEYRLRRDGVTVVYHIAVDKQHRGRGIGQALMNSLSLPIRLKVTADNPTAIHFYERYGMACTEESHAGTGRALYVYERSA